MYFIVIIEKTKYDLGQAGTWNGCQIKNCKRDLCAVVLEHLNFLWTSAQRQCQRGLAMHIRSLMASSGILFTVPCWLSLVFTTSYLYVALGGGLYRARLRVYSQLCAQRLLLAGLGELYAVLGIESVWPPTRQMYLESPCPLPYLYPPCCTIAPAPPPSLLINFLFNNCLSCVL